MHARLQIRDCGRRFFRIRTNIRVINRHLAADQATLYISPIRYPGWSYITPQFPKVGPATLYKRRFL